MTALLKGCSHYTANIVSHAFYTLAKRSNYIGGVARNAIASWKLASELVVEAQEKMKIGLYNGVGACFSIFSQGLPPAARLMSIALAPFGIAATTIGAADFENESQEVSVFWEISSGFFAGMPANHMLDAVLATAAAYRFQNHMGSAEGKKLIHVMGNASLVMVSTMTFGPVAGKIVGTLAAATFEGGSNFRMVDLKQRFIAEKLKISTKLFE